MSTKIFINLPVTDLARSRAFYEAIGFPCDPRFTNEDAVSMILSDDCQLMLLGHDFWKTFTSRAIPDAHASAQLLLAISREDRAAVDAIVAHAAANGGTSDPNPRQDHGFMYGRSFADPDGHIWEPNWMDMDAAMRAHQTGD